MSDYSSAHDYATARNLRGSKLELAGPTYNHREWIKSAGGVWDKATKTWSLPMPSNNRTASAVLYEITKRGMQWRAA